MPNQFTTPDIQVSAQTTQHIFMIRPANFGANPETAADNVFQHTAKASDAADIAEQARLEFDVFVAKLRAAGVNVLVVEDTPHPIKTDAVFPNNWITTHDDGVVVTYPMYSPIRRVERRRDIIDLLAEHFSVTRYITLEAWEEQERMLEGTGSMILDREHRQVYACLSKRTDLKSLQEWASMMRYELIAFHAIGSSGLPLYHTNVMMAIGTSHAVVCPSFIHDATEREQVLAGLRQAGKTVLELTEAQIDQFAGNMLELKGADGPVWAMSTAAFNALTATQRDELQSSQAKIVHSDLGIIEKYGGGSARCMMAEIFLPE
ncbi:MAG: arginine deiminase-related protein [Bacteroidota bacterium]